MPRTAKATIQATAAQDAAIGRRQSGFYLGSPMRGEHAAFHQDVHCVYIQTSIASSLRVEQAIRLLQCKGAIDHGFGKAKHPAQAEIEWEVVVGTRHGIQE